MITFSMVEVAATEASAVSFSGNASPRRYPPSAVMRSFASASSIRSDNESAENQPNTIECGAPILAHANIATGSSGIIGM